MSLAFRCCLLLASTLVMSTTTKMYADDALVFVSAFASGQQGAIHAFRLDLGNSELKPLQRTTDVEHPFFMALSPDFGFLYSIHARVFSGKEHEQIAAYKIVGRDGSLKLLNRQSAQGTAACYLDVDATSKTLVVANYSTGSVASLPMNDDGSLRTATSFVQHVGSSVNPQRQKEPHAHCFVISPDNRFAFAADLGVDKIFGYQLAADKAKLSSSHQAFVRTPPGAGPRHLTFHPNGKRVYVINELANSVTMFEYEPADGMLLERQTVGTLPEDFSGTSHTADLKITPDGRYLYGTNRGHDSIAAYRIGNDGQLTLLEIKPSLGKGPQNLLITPDGKHLLCANMPSDNVAVFRIDGASGKLTSVGEPITMPKPSCIMLVP